MITFETTECDRCNGEGVIDIYRHVAGGTCAKCSGSKVMLSRRGVTAHRAYETALADRCGKWGV